MQTNIPSKRSATMPPSMIWHFNWVFLRFKDDTSCIEIMTVYDYQRIWKDIKYYGGLIGVKEIQHIKPRNERDYLLINKLDKVQLEYFEKQQFENGHKS